jgi:CHASE3 domain sensor protein
MKLRQQKIFGAGITLVIISVIIIAVFSFYQISKINDLSSRIDYIRNVFLQLSDLYNTTIEHAGSARNYSLNGNEEDTRKMQSTASGLRSKFEELKGRIKKDFAVQIQLDSLEKYITKRIEFSNKLIAEGKEKGLPSAAALYQTGAGRDYNNIIFSFIQQLQAVELSTLQLNEKKNTGSIGQLNLYLPGLPGFILILIIILVQKSRLDIALRKKTEEHLKSFNQQLQKQVSEKTAELTGVFDRITDGFIAPDKNFCFTYVNKKAGEMTSRDPDSFIGKNIWKEFDKDISPLFRSSVLKAMRNRNTFTLKNIRLPITAGLKIIYILRLKVFPFFTAIYLKEKKLKKSCLYQKSA